MSMNRVQWVLKHHKNENLHSLKPLLHKFEVHLWCICSLWGVRELRKNFYVSTSGRLRALQVLLIKKYSHQTQHDTKDLEPDADVVRVLSDAGQVVAVAE